MLPAKWCVPHGMSVPWLWGWVRRHLGYQQLYCMRGTGVGVHVSDRLVGNGDHIVVRPSARGCWIQESVKLTLLSAVWRSLAAVICVMRTGPGTALRDGGHWCVALPIPLSWGISCCLLTCRGYFFPPPSEKLMCPIPVAIISLFIEPIPSL